MTTQWHVCSKQALLYHFKWLKLRIFGFWQKETWSQESFLGNDRAYGCHLLSFLMYISDARCEEHYFNISRDILYSIFYLSRRQRLLICIIHKCQYLYNEKRYSKKEHAILLYFKKRLSDKQQLFFMSYTQIFGCYTISKCLACPPFQYISFFQAHIFVISIQSHYSISTHREFIKVR